MPYMPLYFGYWMCYCKDFSYDRPGDYASYAYGEHDYTGAQIVFQNIDAPYNSIWQFNYDTSHFTNIVRVAILDFLSAKGDQATRDPRPWTLWAICRLMSKKYLILPSLDSVVKSHDEWGKELPEEAILQLVAEHLRYYIALLEPFSDAFPAILIADEPVKGDSQIFTPWALNQIATGLKYFQGAYGTNVLLETPVMYNHFALDAVWRQQPPIPTQTDFVSCDPYLVDSPGIDGASICEYAGVIGGDRWPRERARSRLPRRSSWNWRTCRRAG